MPTATGLPRPFEVWKYTSTLPTNDGSGKWDTTTVLVSIIARGTGSYWSLTVKPLTITGPQPFHKDKPQLWVDASYWHSKGDLVYIGAAGSPAVAIALARIKEANEREQEQATK